MVMVFIFILISYLITGCVHAYFFSKTDGTISFSQICLAIVGWPLYWYFTLKDFLNSKKRKRL